MYKILFFVALFAAMYFGWKYSRVQQRRLNELERQRNRQGDVQRKSQSDKKEVPAEMMVPCARCGVYVPKSEAYFKNNKYYCCSQHLREDN